MENKNNGYILGIIGGLIGGLIATIPWVLVYVYLNYILSALAIVIAIGVLKGYQIFKGKVGKPLPVIVAVISVICVTLATLVFIPKLLIIKENAGVTISELYQNSDFSSAIIKDYITSLLFTALGISGVIASINKQVKSGKTEIKINNNEEYVKEINEKKDKIKEIFIKYNATEKSKTVSKEQILNEVDFDDKDNVFKYMLRGQLIKKANKEYYYSIDNEEHPNKRAIKISIIAVIITFLLILIPVLFSQMSDNSKLDDTNNVVNSVDNYTVEIDKNYEKYVFDDSPGIIYYLPKDDSTGESGVISIQTDTLPSEYKKYEDFKKYIVDYLKAEFETDDLEVSDLKTKNNYSLLKVKLEIEEYKSVETLYYLIDNDKFAIIYSTSYPSKKNDVEDVTKKMVDTFKWK